MWGKLYEFQDIEISLLGIQTPDINHWKRRLISRGYIALDKMEDSHEL
jgi:hypothetical protein